MKHFKITQEQLQGILNYLQSKPFVEVHQLISMILSLKEEVEVEREKEERDNK